MSRRTERIGELLRHELSQLVSTVLRDPRLARLVTVSRVDVSADLQHATVAVTALGSEDEQAEALQGLVSAGGFLRRSLAQRLGLRRMPELTFAADSAIRQGDQVLFGYRDIFGVSTVSFKSNPGLFRTTLGITRAAV